MRLAIVDHQGATRDALKHQRRCQNAAELKLGSASPTFCRDLESGIDEHIGRPGRRLLLDCSPDDAFARPEHDVAQ